MTIYASRHTRDEWTKAWPRISSWAVNQEAGMTTVFRRRVVTIATTIAIVSGAWAAHAQQAGKEAHPAIDRAIEQIGAIKGRLQSAPKDFGGHKQKAIEALNLAADELRQAKQFDK